MSHPRPGSAQPDAVAKMAPLALFTFRRQGSTHAVLDALEQCEGFAATPVTVFSDAGRNEGEAAEVERLRQSLRSRLRPNMQLVERATNLGLAASVIAGVGDLVAQHGRVIVLEDDLPPAPAFLAWFNAALDRFEDEPRVMQVAAHMFDVPAIRRAGRGVFLRHPTSKGWAVWRRSWEKFDADCVGWESSLADPAFRQRFRVKGAMRFEEMLRRQMEGRLSSWAIRFHYTVVKVDGLVLYPPMSLVSDIGPSVGQATHGQRTAKLLPPAPVWPGAAPPPLPAEVAPDDWAVDAWARRLNRSAYGLAQGASAIRDAVSRRLSKPGP